MSADKALLLTLEAGGMDLSAFRLGIRRAVRNPMTDVALNILALIAGGLTLELFTSARPFTHSQQKPTLAGTELPEGLEDFAGNPS